MTICIQSKGQDAVTASGGEAIGFSRNLSYSIGQPFTDFKTGSANSINQGVQQPLILVATVGILVEPLIVEMSVFPNPTINYVTLEIGQLNSLELNAQLFDVHGKLVQKIGVSDALTKIQLPELSNTIYLLKVIQKNKELGTFIIVKN